LCKLIFKIACNYLYVVTKFLTTILVGTMTIVILAQIISRSFLGYSIYWSEEFARYCLIWITFIGASLAYRNLELAAFDLLLNNIPKKIKWIYSIIIDFILLSFFGILIYYGFLQTFKPSTLIQLSPAMRAPMWIVYLSAPLGFTFMFVYALDSLVQTIRTRNEGEPY